MNLRVRFPLFWLALVLVLASCRPGAAPTPTAAPSAAPTAPSTAINAAPTAPGSPLARPLSPVATPVSPVATPLSPIAMPVSPLATPAAAGTPTTGTAFGQPALGDIWTPGGKLGVGTAYTYDQAGGKDRPAPSRVWFSLTGGAITEMEYPTVDRANVRELSLLVARPVPSTGSTGSPTGSGTGPSTGPTGLATVQRETDLSHWITPTVEYLDPRALAYRLTTKDPGGAWQAVKEVVTDPAGDSLITRWRFTSSDPAATGYAYLVPHLAGSGKGDTLAIKDGAVVFWDEAQTAGPAAQKVYGVLLMDPVPSKASVGYLRVNDGLTDLDEDGQLTYTFDQLPKAGYGAATLALPRDRAVTMVVGFGANEADARKAAQATLARGFDAVAGDYIAGWHRYLARLTGGPQDDPLYDVSAMVLKAHEDKTNLGAGVASLSTPWGQCLPDSKEAEQGYRYVWPRDLYHVARAYLALGDRDSARQVLDYMAKTLQQPDGHFPQNAFVDGSPRWTAIQLDETADPILLAAALGAQDLYAKLVKPAADYLASKGPATQQERWEENGGYSPATIAAEIAGLAAASDMADKANDAASAEAWRAKADAWAQNLDGWTFTTNGPYGNGRYYLRVTTAGKPNDTADRVTISNGGGPHPAQEVVDVSALELVRLGVRRPDAQNILDTLQAIDARIRVNTANGPDWYRYAFDSYGEPAAGKCAPGKGRPWPIFAGERGMYALAAGKIDDARARLADMRKFANDGLMIPEQVWENSGEGTGSATPLVWAHAEYILLTRSIQTGKVLDMPDAAAARYLK